MYASVVLASLFAGAAFVRADVGPTTPAPGDVFNEGGDCKVAWNADTSGVWTAMNVEFMTGNNEAMQFLEVVATVDGTDASNNSITWKCPDVDLNSQVYFYQFTSPYSKNVYWTGRFTIASSDGSTTPPPETEVSGGQTISWGSGSIIGQSPSTAPAYGESTGVSASASASGSASSSTASSASSSSGSSDSSSDASSPAAAPESSTPSGPPLTKAATSSVVTVRSSAAATSPGVATASTSTAANGAGALKADNLVLRAGMALILAGLTFTVAL
ncbi:uncharacterized protein C8Q71DRAFT_850326 [Rhodofomes roseus]|uniref:Yeast cell wall synthesis Kre9/Knh1-like N-terminal domain-containing protein n=1 Tax=Rhodofomes roseus TaxID=34475 RepID=A0A4Y9YJ73_9APHY|nr:uncharacterized protein C8Q71DRAFT_850326 [Rhodofomes roseus]KAH9832650.1 hypothetical protein C8Q71DRAFT_850326 [Rhodofomes roseus]TFY61501.1 hypothetical protein EVJ58_g4477 [Rhodofomes roseus]